MTELTDAYLQSQGISRDLVSQFWTKTNKTDSCWIWTKRTNIGGYGVLWDKLYKTTILAHRLSWIINVGPIPSGFRVLHNCPRKDNPSCVNPDHLWIGTDKDNVRDSIKKGTFVPNPFKPGDSHCCRKLTSQQVKEIRNLYASGKFFHKDLAFRFRVSRSAISSICRCVNWKIIEGVPIYGKGRAKIDFEDAQQIRQMYSDGQLTQIEIGRLFGITQSDVSHLVNGRIWS